MRQVAAAGLQGHMGSVPKALTTLLVLVALLLTPMGMSGMPAAAASPDSAALSSHCDGHGDERDHVPAAMEQHCATCIVVPIAAGPQVAPRIAPRAPRTAMATISFIGVELEVSTPPPRRA